MSTTDWLPLDANEWNAYDGSISAGHGVDQLKVVELPHDSGARELRPVARIEAAFDSRGVLNPGKLLVVHML